MKSARNKASESLRQFTFIELAERNGVALLTLNRPDADNAIDDAFATELKRALELVEASSDVRALVLLAAGKSFCAGVDANAFARRAANDQDRTSGDARAIADLLQRLATLTKPTIARVHGETIGVGVGLVACCDIAIASVDATFALPDASVGLIPAAVAPYFVEAIGARRARRYMLTAESFDAAEAYRIGLVHDLVPSIAALDEAVNATLGSLLVAGPRALAATKGLIRATAHRPLDERVIAECVEHDAKVHEGDEAREGIAAVVARRSPPWVPTGLRKSSRARKDR
ncbi:MAG TPA: enoyl-CoA hydratase-related protein [Casimicrobiaceae bacterium]|nr:enoyl-CoA hydratase-related protein [Casimicrobiaceae bacterium]